MIHFEKVKSMVNFEKANLLVFFFFFLNKQLNLFSEKVPESDKYQCFYTAGHLILTLLHCLSSVSQLK